MMQTTNAASNGHVKTLTTSTSHRPRCTAEADSHSHLTSTKLRPQLQQQAMDNTRLPTVAIKPLQPPVTTPASSTTGLTPRTGQQLNYMLTSLIVARQLQAMTASVWVSVCRQSHVGLFQKLPH